MPPRADGASFQNCKTSYNEELTQDLSIKPWKLQHFSLRLTYAQLDYIVTEIPLVHNSLQSKLAAPSQNLKIPDTISYIYDPINVL